MKTKVFHIVTHFDIGGSETVALNISKSKNPDYEFHMVEVVKGSGEYSDAFIKDLGESGIYYHRSPISTNFILGALFFPFWYWKIHRECKPDVYHTHTESPDVALYLFFLLFGWMIDKKNIRVVRTLHNTKLWKGKHMIGNVIEKFFLKYHANVSISEPVKNRFLNDFPFYDKEIPVFFNGLAEREQVPFDLDKSKTNILFAGRMVEQKGIPVLADVIKSVNEKENNLFFHIVGEGPLHEDLKAAIGGFGNVKFHGNVYGLATYLGSFDYLFMPSVHEGLSMLAIESSFARLPIIINSCEGLVDTVPDEWPLKVKNNSVEDFVRIFEHLDSIDRNKLTTYAYDFVAARFGIKQMQEKYLRWYSKW